jgi:sulfoxide reductase heme-binding subunit YedZ
VGVTSSPVAWYAARAAGVVAYLLLTVVVLVGLTLSGRRRLAWPRFAVEDVHRFGGLLVGVFVWIHVLAVALDTYTPFSLADLIVPFRADYRPLWTAVGVVAAELLLALALTNSLRRRIPHGLWRTLHRLNLVVWLGASAHGLGSGTDRATAWLLTLYLLSIASVAAATAVRLSSAPAPARRASAT